MPTIHLSPKLMLTEQHGFAMNCDGQPRYVRDWHEHDCAMLLWPHSGGLKAAWAGSGDAAMGSIGLSRSTALLLPASTAHNTRASTADQRHGELYLAPERLGRHARFGALRLDGALLAMLDALVAPTLVPESADPLVDAVVRQLSAGPGQVLSSVPPPALGERMAQVFAQALEWDQPVPLVDDVARQLGVSMRQLQRCCGQEFGASPIDVRRRMLATRARSLMAQGATLAQASVRLGFASSGHLGRLLRAVVG